MKFTRLNALVLIGLLKFVLPATAFALPTCYQNDRTTPITDSNQDVLNWMKNNDNNWHRAMLTGVVTKRLPDQTGHAHFLISLGTDNTSDVEVIHQSDFGAIPDITPGMNVAVCGDFKRELMDGVQGFIHWTHCNPGTQQPNHPQGFVSVNGYLYGITAPSGEPTCDSSKP